MEDCQAMADATPTVRRRRLGMELRRLREGRGFGIEDAAKHLECSTSKISRLETAKAAVRVRDVRDLLDFYGLEDTEQRELLLDMARTAKEQRGWWTDVGVLPAGLETYVAFESEAESLRSFQPLLISGLLQTERYIRAVVGAGRPDDTPEGIERLVELRLRRQEALRRENPLQLWTVLDEATVRRVVGGAEVMAEQIQHLLEAAALPNVTIQVLPFTKGAHAGLNGPFAILEFPGPDPDVVYVDSAAGNIYPPERLDQTRGYTLAFDHLRATALSPAESKVFLEQVG